LEKPFGVLKGEIEEKERRVKEERRAKDVVMEILLDVVMEKNSFEEKTSLSTQVGALGPAAWASPRLTGGGTCSGPTAGMDSTITTETNQVIGLFTCLRGCRPKDHSVVGARHARVCEGETWIPVEWPTSLGDRLYAY
jgi:hypothetical protein